MVGATGLFAFTSLNGKTSADEKFKKYEVIHHADGQNIIADTLVPMSSTYTPEEFVASLGIDASSIEIIDLSGFEAVMGANAFVFSDNRISKTHENGSEKVKVKVITDGDDEGDTEDHFVFKHMEDGDMDVEKTVEYRVVVDENGNKTTQKFVNGEEVEYDPATDDEHLHIHNMDGIMDGDSVRKEIQVMLRTSSDFDGDQAKMMHFNSGHKMPCDSMSNVWIEKIKGMDGLDTAAIREMGGKVIMIEHDVDEESNGDGEVIFMKKRSAIHTSDGDFTMVIVTEGIEPGVEKKHISENKVEVGLYPNPAEDILVIEFEADGSEKTAIEILDVNGKVVLKKVLGKVDGRVKEAIDISEQSPGVYLVKIKQGKSFTTEKLIIR